MVRHEAVGPDFNLLLAAPLGHQIEIGLVVVVAEERLLTPIAALRHVVRHARYNHSCKSSHADTLPGPIRQVKSYVWCPRNYCVSPELLVRVPGIIPGNYSRNYWPPPGCWFALPAQRPRERAVFEDRAGASDYRYCRRDRNGPRVASFRKRPRSCEKAVLPDLYFSGRSVGPAPAPARVSTDGRFVPTPVLMMLRKE